MCHFSASDAGYTLMRFCVQSRIIGRSRSGHRGDVKHEGALAQRAGGVKRRPALAIGETAALGSGEAGPIARHQGSRDRLTGFVRHHHRSRSAGALLALTGTHGDAGDGNLCFFSVNEEDAQGGKDDREPSFGEWRKCVHDA